MSDGLRILIVEDVAVDAEVEVHELRRAGIACDFHRVETASEYRRDLKEFNPHVIVSDFSMPQFDGMTALAMARQSHPHIPFIFVSGKLGDCDSMKITPIAWAGAEQESLATIEPRLSLSEEFFFHWIAAQAVAELRAVGVNDIMNDTRMSSLKESFQERGGDTAFRCPRAVE